VAAGTVIDATSTGVGAPAGWAFALVARGMFGCFPGTGDFW
jgi:hypothetical protein